MGLGRTSWRAAVLALTALLVAAAGAVGPLDPAVGRAAPRHRPAPKPHRVVRPHHHAHPRGRHHKPARKKKPGGKKSPPAGVTRPKVGTPPTASPGSTPIAIPSTTPPSTAPPSTPPAPPTTDPSPTPPVPKTNPCPTTIPGDTLQLGRTFALAGEDTFTTNAPAGSFAQSSVSSASVLAPIYVGDHGMGWSVYPDGWPATYTASGVEGYQPSTVLTVHDGVLDYYLHDDANGNPVGADLSPWPGGNEYQTYGAYSFCEKVVPTAGQDLADFYESPLLWPENASDGRCAESDFPESYAGANNKFLNGGSLASGQIYAFAHHGTWSASAGCQTGALDKWTTSAIALSQWHVFTQEWGPGYRSYYVDGQLVYTTTNQVWSQPERWQLQIEPSPLAQLQRDGGTGHLYIAWVWIGKLAS